MTGWIPEPIAERISSPPLPCPALDRILDQPDPEQSPLEELLESSDCRANREIAHLQRQALERQKNFLRDLIFNVENFIQNHPHISLQRIQREANEQLQMEIQKIRQNTAEQILTIRKNQCKRDDGIYRHFGQEPPIHPPLTPTLQNPLHNPFQIRIENRGTGNTGWQI